MPKAKKSTTKQRQTPYPTPRQPTIDPRAQPSEPPIPNARDFAPPRGFTRTVPNPAYPHITLTTGELNQSFLDFIRDQQNGTSRSPDVDESRTPGSGPLADNERHGEDEPDGSEMGGSSGGGTGAVEEVVGEDGIGQGWNDSTTLNLGKKKVQQPVDSPNNNGENGNPPTRPALATPKVLTEDEMWRERLAPVQKYNDETPWPTPFYEQPIQAPAWHAECPEGYEPTTLAGYPIRRQYPIYIPAAHDPEMVLNEHGHYCIDLKEPREWDQCCMGKCNGCEICRPGF